MADTSIWYIAQTVEIAFRSASGPRDFVSFCSFEYLCTNGIHAYN